MTQCDLPFPLPFESLKPIGPYLTRTLSLLNFTVVKLIKPLEMGDKNN